VVVEVLILTLVAHQVVLVVAQVKAQVQIHLAVLAFRGKVLQAAMVEIMDRLTQSDAPEVVVGQVAVAQVADRNQMVA
jgi:hypothetical protein